MKIQIDSEKKTVKILEDANLNKLVKFLKHILGDDYEEYTFIASDYTYWAEYPWYIYSTPWTTPIQPYTTCYNVELKESN
jgi:hypothetical protein